MKRLVLGIGSGRCGTKSLASLLDSQPDARVTHELWDAGRGARWAGPLPWQEDLGALHRALTEIQRYPGAYVGDVASFWLPYVDRLLSDKSLDVRIVALRRNKKEVVESFLEKTADTNHWMKHTGQEFKLNTLWDASFPKYDVPSKREAIERYWEEYYSRVDHLVAAYPRRVRLWEMHLGLNIESGRAAICDFVGFERYTTISGRARENASPGLLRRVKRQVVKRLEHHGKR